jgi:hypothetical protein
VLCDRPHSVEVFAVRDVTTLFGSTPRRALDEEGNPARQRYLSLITEFCEPAWSDYSGFGELGSSLTPRAVVLPAIYGDMALEASPAADWDAGKRIVTCYQVLGRPGADGERAISVDRPVLTMLGRAPAAVPLQVRDCAMSPVPDQPEKRVSCQEPHDREYLGHLNLAQFVGLVPGLDQAFLNRFNSASAPAKDWAVLDGLCGRIFRSLPGRSRTDITLTRRGVGRTRVHTTQPASPGPASKPPAPLSGSVIGPSQGPANPHLTRRSVGARTTFAHQQGTSAPWR